MRGVFVNDVHGFLGARFVRGQISGGFPADVINALPGGVSHGIGVRAWTEGQLRQGLLAQIVSPNIPDAILGAAE